MSLEEGGSIDHGGAVRIENGQIGVGTHRDLPLPYQSRQAGGSPRQPLGELHQVMTATTGAIPRRDKTLADRRHASPSGQEVAAGRRGLREEGLVPVP